MQSPEFSVVIPLFNKREFIAQTLRSVLAQSRPAREIIVVDNGSTDGSDRIVTELAEPAIRLLREAQPGPAPARNCGIAVATADWIAFIDADDLWSADHLERLAEVIDNHPAADLVATGFRRVESNAAIPEPAGPAGSRWLDFFGPGEANHISTSSVAIRRETLLAHGGFANLPAGEDTDLWIRLAMRHRFAISAATTAAYVRANGGIMEREAAGIRDQAPPPSPVFATIAALLAAPEHAARHQALADYGDALRRLFAWQLAYHGHGAAARSLLDGCQARPAGWWLAWLISLVPGRLLRLAARLRNRLT